MKRNTWYSRYVNANDFGTDNASFQPEIWAQESLMILEENLIAANLVHRDFENEIKSYGETVHTRRPGIFTARRKVDGDSITKQPATATPVEVKLNQHLHTSFIIYDAEASKSIVDLVALYLRPAIRSIAKTLDSIVIAQKYQFLANSVGQLGVDPDKNTIIDLNTMLDTLMIPEDNRYGIVTAATKGSLLKDEFLSLHNGVDGQGQVIRDATIGQLYNTQFLMSTNNKTIADINTKVVDLLVNNAAGYPAGTTSIAVNGHSGALVNGTWILIAGDPTPHYIVSSTGGATPSAMVISPGLKSTIADDAVVSMYTNGEVDNASGYAINWGKSITTDGFTVAPQIGQLVTFEGDTELYASLETGKAADGTTIDRTTNLVVDKPLASALANNDDIFLGPPGNFNWIFHRNAVALVTRPLALPPPGYGVKSYVASYNGLSIRICIGYDKDVQGMVVTADLLCGVKTLDTNLGAVLLA